MRGSSSAAKDGATGSDQQVSQQQQLHNGLSQLQGFLSLPFLAQQYRHTLHERQKAAAVAMAAGMMGGGAGGQHNPLYGGILNDTRRDSRQRLPPQYPRDGFRRERSG